MAILIKQNLVIEDPWTQQKDFTGSIHTYPNFSILPLKAFAESDQYPLAISYLGAWFDADVDYGLFQKQSLSLPVLNITVEDFHDGRVFTLAKLIRTRFKYLRELRLSGNFLIEQMAMFRACGVDSFSLPDDSDYDYALYILRNTPLSTY
jgi:uncharacterized protein (DUF934 family)